MDIPKTRLLRIFTLLYLVFPAILFACGWLRLPFSVVSIFLITIVIIYALRDIYRVFQSEQLFSKIKNFRWEHFKPHLPIASAYLLFTSWLLLSGTGGFGAQNTDYWASNALFKDLIVQKWPLTVAIEGSSVPVVYYVAYFLPAAAFGKLFGWAPANIFLFIWTWIGIVLSFNWFWQLSRIDFENNVRRALGLTAVFCLAGGLDIIGAYVLRRSAFDITYHIEVWADYFQYSSQTTLIYWVPQQAIAGWLIVSLISNYLHQRQDLRYLGIIISVGVIWSPFAIFGVLPFLIWVLISYLHQESRSYLFNRNSLLLNLSSLWAGGIHSLNILSNQYKFPIGLIFNLVDNSSRLVYFLIVFWLLEFVLLALLLLSFLARAIARPNSIVKDSRRSLRNQWNDQLNRFFGIKPIQLYIFIVCFNVLLLLPLFKVGYRNDLVMRVSIPSLFLFWTFIAKVVMDAPTHIIEGMKRSFIPILFVVILGFFPAISEISRSILNFRFGPPVISEVSAFTDLSDFVVEQRLGSEETFFYRYIGK